MTLSAVAPDDVPDELDAVIKALKQPVLGICLGMQLMCKYSEENNTECIGIFEETVKRIPYLDGLKVPHMGWNRLKIRRASPLLEGLTENDYFYFAHTFAAQAADGETLAVCDYGAEFGAVLAVDRVCAVQFHPEKSGGAGSILLSNFLRMAA